MNARSLPKTLRIALASLLPLGSTGCLALVPLDGLDRGSRAPRLEVSTWVGDSTEGALELTDDGGPTLVEFWSKDCPPCVRKIEVLRELHARLAGRLRIVTVHMDLKDTDLKGAPSRDAVEEFVAAHAIPYPVGIDEAPDRWEEWSFRALPHAVLLDGRRVVWSGNLLVWDLEKGLARLGLSIDPGVPSATGEVGTADGECRGGVCSRPAEEGAR